MNEYTLFFAKSYVAENELDERTIAVWPVDPKWNDFGYGFQAEVKIRKSDSSSSKQFLSLRLFVVPDPIDDNIRFNNWLEKIMPNQKITKSVDLGSNFFSILSDEESYLKLVTWLKEKPSELEAILLPLRDIVYFRKSLLQTESLERLLRHKAMTQGIFRRESTFLAWHRSWRLLGGGSNELIDDARNDFSFSTHLPGFTSAHILSIKFGAPAPLVDRCHALIGRNGVGKSRLLRELIIRIGLNAQNSEAELFMSDGRPADENSSVKPDGIRYNRVLVLTWDSQSSLPDGVRLDAPFEYLHFQMNGKPESREETINQSEVALDSSDRLTPLLLQMMRENIVGDKVPFENLRKSLRPIFDIHDFSIAVQNETGNKKWVTISELASGGEQAKLDKLGQVIQNEDPVLLSPAGNAIALSSGERMFLHFGIRCAARITKGSIVILDEPETHLHPNLISDFMRVLANLLSINKSIALIATHSPFVVRELPSRCVHVFSVDEDKNPMTNSAYLRTLGSNIDRLSIDIFGDEKSDQLNIDLAKSIAKDAQNFDAVLKKYGTEVSAELLSRVRDLIDAKAI